MMGQAKRRRLAKETAAIETEAAGVYAVMIVTPQIALEMGAAALEGNLEAETYMLAIAHCLREIPKRRPRLLCLTCDKEFSAQALPAAFALFHAYRDDAKTALGNGLCDACATKPDLEGRVLAAYKEKLLGDLRVLPRFSPGSPTQN